MTRSRGNMALPWMTVAGGDAVDAHEGRELDGEFAHEVVGGGLAGVVGDAAFFRDDGVGAGREHERAAQFCSFQSGRGFVGDEVEAGDVDGVGERPLVVGDVALGVGRDEDAAVMAMESMPP